MSYLMNKFNNSSKDAKTFAPSSCAAETEQNNSFFSDIALAMSVLLCLILVNVLSIYGIIIGIIILNIIIKNKFEKAKALSWICESFDFSGFAFSG